MLLNLEKNLYRPQKGTIYIENVVLNPNMFLDFI
jgi:hypothetical protein